MKITVVGAGAVGGYFGGRLLAAGMDVTFLVREQRAQQLRENGLVIQSPHGDANFMPNLALQAREIDECDLILLSVKNYHLPAVMDSIRLLVERGARILPLLNGVEHYELLKQQFGADAILGGLCQIIATLDQNGRIVHSNKLHTVTFGPLSASQAQFCRGVQEVFREVNSKWQMSDQILVDIWSKYIFITAFSGLTTASRLPIDQVLACPATAEIYERTLTEMTALSAASSVILPDGFVEMVMEQSRRQPAGATSSMHQDLRRNLPIEVESLQGYAVRLANQMDISTPVLKTLYGLLKPHERETFN